MTEAIKSIEPTVAAAASGAFGVSAAAGAHPAVVASTPSTPAVQAAEPSEPLVDPQAVQRAVQEAVAQLLDSGVELSYHVDNELKRVVVEVRDRADGTVLRQIPGEEVLRMARRLRDGQGGLLQVTA